MVSERIANYLATGEMLRRSLDLAAVGALAEAIADARDRGATVFICGNGGSASTASHFATDLQKNTIAPGRPRIRALSLTDNGSLITAWANDADYSRVFAEQVLTFGRPGDLLVAISASGNSPNLLAAAEAARSQGMTVVGLTGFSGGALRVGADIVVHVPVESYELAEDAHLLVCHLVMSLLKAGRTAVAVAAAERVEFEPRTGASA